MISTKFLSPEYIEHANLSPKMRAYALDVLRKSWLIFTQSAPLVAALYPWGQQRTVSLLQKCYESGFKYDWLSFIKLARMINETGDHDACCMELFYATCHEWARRDFESNKTICIYSSIAKDNMIVGRKSLDPHYICKISIIPLTQSLCFPEKAFYKIAFLPANQKFTIDCLKDIEYYE